MATHWIPDDCDSTQELINEEASLGKTNIYGKDPKIFDMYSLLKLKQ